MIRYVQGNLLEAPSEALVNTVNEVGVMGKGIALQFNMKEDYVKFLDLAASIDPRVAGSASLRGRR